MKKYLSYYLMATSGGVITFGNVIVRYSVDNVFDDGSIPVANITSRLLGVKLENRCNLRDDVIDCRDDNYISGKWCCESEVVQVENNYGLRGRLSKSLGEAEPYLGLALIIFGIAGSIYNKKMRRI